MKAIGKSRALEGHQTAAAGSRCLKHACVDSRCLKHACVDSKSAACQVFTCLYNMYEVLQLHPILSLRALAIPLVSMQHTAVHILMHAHQRCHNAYGSVWPVPYLWVLTCCMCLACGLQDTLVSSLCIILHDAMQDTIVVHLLC